MVLESGGRPYRHALLQEYFYLTSVFTSVSGVNTIYHSLALGCGQKWSMCCGSGELQKANTDSNPSEDGSGMNWGPSASLGRKLNPIIYSVRRADSW